LPPVEGQRLASFATPGHIAFIVSNVPDQQFGVIAQALATPVSSRLAMLSRNIRVIPGD
jgi:hypothetical protein